MKKGYPKTFVTTQWIKTLIWSQSFHPTNAARKAKKALKFVDEDDSIVGVHELTPEIVTELERKHPKPEPVDESIILPEQNIIVQPVIFERIDSEAIIRSAQNIHGSGGPTRIDADTWKNLICSKAHGSEGMQLSEEIANLSKKIVLWSDSFWLY